MNDRSTGAYAGGHLKSAVSRNEAKMQCPGDSPRPLNVVIVGAGIGGLAAAISLRRNGHRITIFEASQSKSEIGAGITVQRNAVRVLKHLGYSKENLKAIDFDGAELYDAKTGARTTAPWLIAKPEDEDIFCHRNDLHEELARLATGEGDGPPVQIRLGSKILACDPEVGTVTLNNGESISADLVVGADGIHSAVRTGILGHVVKAPPSGLSCFRCLFDTSALNTIPDLDWLTDGISGARVVAWREGGPIRSFFIYKCSNGSLVNLVGYYADAAQDEPTWTPTVTREEILETFKGFNPRFLRIFDLPADSPPMRWQLRALPLISTWIRGRTALLGDSAHASLPLLGQGAAMAFEEAATLGCLLPLGTNKEDVPVRLEAYQTLRKERGDYMNAEAQAQAAVPEKRGIYLTSREMQRHVLEYDAIKVAGDYYEAHFGDKI
ncbi:FAD/NAD(P)-binding domain-containing protein [Mycena metata]|uniref:FAD/NAD(P)-binding domain-containing protein n=1 Tax=Mycena metata TaxID=1033252 RepID=A0AAD7JNN7_9AGAR|nr:FAD/NAD(P)-binding domain-containing protein [Mycena metata]